MKVPKIMMATFEESLKLSDNGVIEYMIQDVEQPGVKEKPILMKVLAISLMLLLYGLSKLTTAGTQQLFESSPLSQPEINFLPTSAFWLMLVIYVMIWLLTLSKRTKENRFFWIYINSSNFLRWLILEVNLFFLTFFLKPLTIIGVGILSIFIGIVAYAVIRSQKNAMEKLLFGIDATIGTIDKIFQQLWNKLVKYGWLLVIAFFGVKFMFPGNTGVRTDFIGFIGMIGMWVIFDLVVILLDVYAILPYLLYGYYKAKYPEDYRKREGKTQLEWYGEKYFNKHIKGTAQEEQVN